MDTPAQEVVEIAAAQQVAQEVTDELINPTGADRPADFWINASGN